MRVMARRISAVPPSLPGAEVVINNHTTVGAWSGGVELNGMWFRHPERSEGVPGRNKTNKHTHTHSDGLQPNSNGLQCLILGFNGQRSWKSGTARKGGRSEAQRHLISACWVAPLWADPNHFIGCADAQQNNKFKTRLENTTRLHCSKHLHQPVYLVLPMFLVLELRNITWTPPNCMHLHLQFTYHSGFR